MIEFNGYISGKAEKFFLKKIRKTGAFVLYSGCLLCFPFALSICVINEKLLGLIPIIIAITVIFPFIPRSKKEIKSIKPNRICINDDIITCIADKHTETKSVFDVKKVRDYGDFYELIFPVGKISDKFICQKDLLSKGTIEDFEKLFNGRIERKV